ncbi:MAG: lysylphosphatidylglycerol synthase transmembrane domain-containing protein [Candidatus Limnocylindria bacterium]
MRTRLYIGRDGDAGAPRHDGRGARSVRAKGLRGPFLFSYVVGALLLGSLVHWAGFWGVLANTRALSILIDGGIIPLTDMDVGYGLGAPDLGYYVASQDDVDWGVLALCVGLFVLLAMVKALQFHRITVALGIAGSFGQSLRAYVYGHGLNRMLPYDVGNAASASALEARGATLAEGRRVVSVQRLFLYFEIAFFALIGLYYVGLAAWVTQLFWALVIVLVAWFLVRAPERGRPRAGRAVRGARAAIGSLGLRPMVLAELALLSIASFLVVDTAAYFIAQAFTGEVVLLNATGAEILMALVAGYLARLVPVTPGGVGQFEWGFAAALFATGMDPAVAVSIALLVSLVRYFTGALVFLVVVLAYRVDTTLARTLELVRGTRAPAKELA